MHLSYMWNVARILQNREPTVNVDGYYKVKLTGKCPFNTRSIRLTQNDFIIEGTSDNQLLLWGVAGQKKVFFLAEEQRYGTLTHTEGKSINVSAPDRPSEIYHTDLETEQLTLSGENCKDCTMTLTARN